jgi:hypothetical protein
MNSKNTGKEWTWSPKYYYPSCMIVKHLEEELRNMELKPSATKKLKRKKEAQGTGAKYAKDVFQKVFQGFVDLVYFLEFIEDHPELGEYYERSLKDLFGISNDDSSPQPHHHKNRSGSLFVRFVGAALQTRYGITRGFDFRIPLANVIIVQAIEAMQTRLFEDNTELQLFLNNVQNTQLWSKILAKRYADKDTLSRNRIGYCIGISHNDRAKSAA